MERPSPAYQGEEPYLFVCYAHADAEAVFSEVNWLQHQGVNVWWDEGISPGERWSDELGDKIAGSSLLVFFVTPRSAASQHCQDEVYFALDHGRPVLVIHLEPTDVPVGLQLRLGSRQALMRHELPEPEYRQKLLRSVSQHVGTSDTPVLQTTTPSKTTVHWQPRSVAAGIVMLSIVGTVFYLSSGQPTGQKAAQTERSSSDNGSSELIEPRPMPASRPAIAVLPFDNMSGDPAQEYFSDGLSEEIIAALAKNSNLVVIARNSAFTYKGKAHNVQQIGAELGVEYLVEGSVRKGGNRIRITVQLVKTSDGAHLWAKSYDRELTDVLAVQAEVAEHLAIEIGAEYSEAELARVKRLPTKDMNAYDLLLRGAALTRRNKADTNLKARELYQRAIELDPNFATAYAALGFSYFHEGFMGWSDGPDVWRQARELGEKAVALDNSGVLGLQLLASVYALGGRQTEKAMAYIDRALDIDPNSANIHHSRAHVLRFGGRWDESIAAFRDAIRLNPHHLIEYPIGLATSLQWAGRYQEAVAELHRALPMDPDYTITHFTLGQVYHFAWVTQGLPDPDLLDRALEAAEKGISLGDPRFAQVSLAVKGRVMYEQGQFAQLLSDNDNNLAAQPENAGLHSWRAMLLGAAGRPAEALEMARKAIAIATRAWPEALYQLGHAYRLNDQLPEAVETFKSVFDRAPEYAYPHLYHQVMFKTRVGQAIAYAELGRSLEASDAAAALLDLSPDFSVQVWGARNPSVDRAQVERDVAALRKAGLR